MPARSLRRLETKLSLTAVMCLLLMVLSPFPAEALAKRNIANAGWYDAYTPVYSGGKQSWGKSLYWGRLGHGGTHLEKGKDYKVVSGRISGINAGTYTCKIQGIGKYTGTRTMKWEIKPRNFWGNENYVTLTNFKYDGRSHTTRFNKKPAILTNKDYSLSGRLTATKRGTYQVTIRGKRNWCGALYLYWKIS